MTRFNSSAEVLAWADAAAADDWARTEASKLLEAERGYIIDLNPYSTQGARHDWQRGYDGAPPRSYCMAGNDYDTMYQRGAAIRRIHDRLQGKEVADETIRA